MIILETVFYLSNDVNVLLACSKCALTHKEMINNQGWITFGNICSLSWFQNWMFFIHPGKKKVQRLFPRSGVKNVCLICRLVQVVTFTTPSHYFVFVLMTCSFRTCVRREVQGEIQDAFSANICSSLTWSFSIAKIFAYYF